MTGCDRGAIFALGAGGVFFFLGDAGQDPVRHRRIERQQRVRLRAGFVFASADDGRGLEIKLSQIGAGFPVLRIQFDGAFKRGADLFRQAGGRKKSGAVGLLSVNAAQPEMVKAFLRIEIASRVRRRRCRGPTLPS